MSTSLADKVSFLRTVTFLSDAEEGVLAEISRYVFEKQLKRGELAVNEGGKVQALYFLAEGTMKLYRVSADGKEHILHIMRPGDFCNIVPLMDNGPAPANIEALGAVRLYGIPNTALRAIMRRHPKVAGNILDVLARHVRSLVALVEDLSFRTVLSRVAKVLLENALVDEVVRLTQRDIAALAGTAREVVSRLLKNLEEWDFIEIHRQQITLKNINGLKKIVDPAFD